MHSEHRRKRDPLMKICISSDNTDRGKYTKTTSKKLPPRLHEKSVKCQLSPDFLLSSPRAGTDQTWPRPVSRLIDHVYKIEISRILSFNPTHWAQLKGHSSATGNTNQTPNHTCPCCASPLHPCSVFHFSSRKVSLGRHPGKFEKRQKTWSTEIVHLEQPCWGSVQKLCLEFCSFSYIPT